MAACDPTTQDFEALMSLADCIHGNQRLLSFTANGELTDLNAFARVREGEAPAEPDDAAARAESGPPGIMQGRLDEGIRK